VVERDGLVVHACASSSLAYLEEPVTEIDESCVHRFRCRGPHVADRSPLSTAFAARVPHVERHPTKRVAAAGRRGEVDPRGELAPRARGAAELDRAGGAPRRREPVGERIALGQGHAQRSRPRGRAITRRNALRAAVNGLSENGTPSRCDVLHVVWAGLYGGIQTQLSTLVRALDGRPGLTHRVCFLEGSGGLADGLVGEGLAFRLGFRRGWDPRDLWRFAQGLRKARPSIIHVHSPALGPALVATSRADATCVFTQHGLRTEMRNRIFYRAVRRRFARFVVATAALDSRLERYGVEPARIENLPYPLTVPIRTLSDSAGSNGCRVVGLVARLEAEKRVDVFIDVVAALRANGADCAGVIVGDGSLRRELEAQVRSRGLEGHVRLVGVQKNVLEWLDGFDVCLMTSDKDVYPLIAIEAMARGVPLVAMPCDGGLPDLATRGGLLLSDRDPSNAAAVLIGLFESPDRRAELQARGAAVAAEHALENVIPIYESFYERLRDRRETAA